jgi:hypothetical protein
MEKPVNRSFPAVVKKPLLCFSIALLLCILAYIYQSISGTGISRSLAANVPVTTVNGTVFNDVNGNGKRDAGEAGISDVTVHLYDAQGKLEATALTDVNGDYAFSVTLNTDYQIKLDNAADYTTGPLKADRLTAVSHASCDDLMRPNAVLSDSSKPIGPGNYPQIAVNAQTTDSPELHMTIGFTTAKSTVDDFSTASDTCTDCLPCSYDDTPITGAQPELTPTATSQPVATPTVAPTKPVSVPAAPKSPATAVPAPKSPAVAPPIYPNLPATGSDPAGHALP